MLVLARRIGEMLVIGDDVTVTIVGIKCSQARRDDIYHSSCSDCGLI